MTSQRDEFSNATKEVIAKRAGQCCSNPDCHVVTSGPHTEDHKAINLGVAAHITAASLGGPRYNSNLTTEERSSITNAIWLCQKCAKLVDSDIIKFPEEVLIIWKRSHEVFIKEQMMGRDDSNMTTQAPGVLNISAIYLHPSSTNRSCILDIRVSNQGSSDLIINAIELRVLESLRKMPLGQAQYSAMYDLDISNLEEYESHAECQVAQILKPGEADRFGLVITAPTLQQFAGWRFATHFKTNFGITPGPEIEVWLPLPKNLNSFTEVTQEIASKAEKHIKAGDRILATSEPGQSAGYKTFIVIGLAIITYYGPQPLIKNPDSMSYSEFFSEK